MPYRNMTGVTMGNIRSTMTPAADDARPPKGGSPPPPRKCQPKPQQDSFERKEQDIILIADTVPPVGQHAANAALRRGHVVRHLCPSLVRVDARDRLEQTGGKFFRAISLVVFNRLIDPQIGGLARSLPCR